MAVPEEECSSVQSRSSSSPTSYYLTKSVLKSGVILHVLSGHIRSPSSLDIIFGKETTIELVVIGQDGDLQSVCEQPVFGIIKDISILHCNERFHGKNSHVMGRDALVVLSDSGKLSFLTFCNEMHRFFPLTHVQISNPGNSVHQLGRMLAVDASGCFVACSAYADRLALFSISDGAGADFVDKKICYPSEREEGVIAGCGIKKTSIRGTIWSMCFLSKDVTLCCGPLLAVLVNRIGTDWNELLLLGWNLLEADVHLLSEFRDVGPLAYSITEVPHHGAFAILFRLGDMLLMDLTDPYNPHCICKTTFSSVPTGMDEHIFVEETSKLHDGDDEGIFSVAARALLELKDHGMELNKDDDPMNIDDESGILKTSSVHVCAWTWEPTDKTMPKLVLCTDSGAFFMVELTFDSGDAKVEMSDCLYKGQPSKALLWVEDCHDEKHGQMYACCGVAPQGSLRLIRSGISVDKLLETPPVYQGVTGMWTVKMKTNDLYHSFLVISFVEETRVLSVGLSFNDISDPVGFLPDVCTLACGLISDGLLVQIHRSAVTLCLPTNAAHPGGIPLPSPVSSSWQPENTSISLGSVGQNLVVVATSSPCFLIVLGVRFLSAFHYEIYEKQRVRVLNEISCISIPQERFVNKKDYLHSSKLDNSASAALPDGVDISCSFAIGTHKPSVEVLSYTPETGLKVLAEGIIILMNTTGAALSGCVPQDVRLVFVDHLYVLSGLRNGMLLRFEWPASICTSLCGAYCGKSYASSLLLGACIGTTNRNLDVPNSSDTVNNKFPVSLQSIATRRIGVTPVFLVPLKNSLDADIIALSDRPWLLQTARHSLSYASISFQPSTHATAVCFSECPKGVFFVAENRLHLVEMMQSKRLNVQKFHLGGTPRKVLYHGEGRLLLVMRTELDTDTHSSDICCVDTLSGSVVSSYKLEPGEIGKSMELVRVGNEQVLVVGTSLSTGPAIMPSGEAESTRGRLIILCLDHMQNSDSCSITLYSKGVLHSQRASPFREIVGVAAEQLSCSSPCSSPDDVSCDEVKLEELDSWQLRLAHTATLPGMVLAICPYLKSYFLASAGNSFYVCGFGNENPQRMRRYAVGRTRFMITSLTAHANRIAVGDCRDGVLFFSYLEDQHTKKVEQLFCDPVQRLVADCVLMDVETAFVSDRKGSIAVLSSSNHLEDTASPECNLDVSCSYYMGEVAMSVRKGSFSYKFPIEDHLKEGDNLSDAIVDSSNDSIMACTLLGSILIFIPISREEYKLLETVQERLAVHFLTAPILGNNHKEFRGRESSAGVPAILDGDMLTQFLELTSMQQEAILALPPGVPDKGTVSLKTSKPVSMNEVVQVLERVHYALN
uniref:DNA damage-binding protein 1 n=1 Tax=Kalanchoe fedtschenkoi TaxID=63787 RepID=A0A7N0UVI7_KALFE